MRKYQTLHGHTTNSDGKLSYRQALERCAKSGIGVYAFTDHDALMDEKKAEELRGKSGNVDWVSGIEISAGVAEGMEEAGGAHITGLFVNPMEAALREHCERAQEARVERMGRIVRNLKSLGFEINERDCLKVSGGEAVGRPHIVEALRQKEKNMKVMEEIRKKMEEEGKHDRGVKKKYDEMISFGPKQYPYALFLSEDAYVCGVYVDYLYRASLDRSVGMIRAAGGLAFVAHWFTYAEKMTEEMVEKLLRENRLDGMETVYGIGAGGVIERAVLEKQRRVLRRLLEKYKKLEAGGFDAHTGEDFDLFVKEKWYAEMTVGMVEKIIKKSGVDTTWSSLSC